MSNNDLFALDADVEVQAASDSLGKFTLDSALHQLVIKMAYLDAAPSGAQFSRIILGNNKDDRTNSFDVYFTSKADPKSLTAVNKGGKKVPTYGYSVLNDLCLRAAGCSLKEVEVETKQVKVWVNRKEELQPRKVLLSLINKPIAVGIIEVKEDKYDNPGIKVLKNELDKFFDAETLLTTAEIAEGKTEAKFAEAWKAKWEGQIKDKTTAATSLPGAPAAGNASGNAPDLFAE